MFLFYTLVRMKYQKHIRFVDLILLVFLFMVLSSQQAHAYLDPGSGSYLLQLLIAGGVGIIFSIKTFWFQIKTFFSSLFLRKQKKEHSAPKNKNGK